MGFSKQTAFEMLQRATAQGRLAHAYLISGPRGSGKRDLVHEVTGMLHGPAARGIRRPGVHIAEPESKSRRIVVDQIRELEHLLQMRSLDGKRKIGVIFEADRLVAAASNAFLKTLEEPPENSLLLLTTAQPEQLLETIISRCIPIQLESPGRPALTQMQQQVLALLDQFCALPDPALPDVFLLIRRFDDLLREVKESIQTEHEAELKREENLYKQTTEGDWLKDREDHFKALTEARYMEQRFAVVDTLIEWWADVLRQQHGSAQMDLPEKAAATSRLAAIHSNAEVLRRLAALEELRDHLGRNVQESLAMQVMLLRVFGSKI